jgi:F-type H+-transporting ATPase subunit b
MELFNPESGLIIWMLIVFCALLFILAKFAFPVITKAISAREEYISNAIKVADEAKRELAQIEEERKAILNKAREEQNVILKEVQDLRVKLIDDAKNQAKIEAEKIISNARLAIEAEKQMALKEVRNQVAILSVDIAEKVLRKNLQSDKAQMDLVSQLMNEVDILKN